MMKNGEGAGRGRRLAVGAICLALGTLLLRLHAYTYADSYLAEGLRRLTALERDLREGSSAKPEEGDPIARNKYWFSRKGWSLGVPSGAYRSAIEQMARMRNRSSLGAIDATPEVSPSLTWQFLGPQPMLNQLPDFGGAILGPPLANATGRLTALAADPRVKGRIFIGAAGGGMWMSSDGGNTSASISTLSTQAIGAIALDPATNPTTVYVGTGEGNGSLDSYYGRGLFRSSDVGLSWTQLAPGTFDGSSFTSLAIDPSKTPPVVFAGITDAGPASRADAFFSTSNTANNGLWRSTDGGASWFQYLASTFGGCMQRGGPCQADDIKIDPVHPQNVYAAIDAQNVYRSTNEGDTWSAVSFPGVPGGAMGRESLAIAPSSPSTVYAMLGAPDGYEYVGFFVSTDSGA